MHERTPQLISRPSYQDYDECDTPADDAFENNEMQASIKQKHIKQKNCNQQLIEFLKCSLE